MEIVPFLLAKKLKEKGFREKVEHFYDRFENDWRCLEPSNMNDTENCSAPTISQVLKWLREEKKISIEPTIHSSLKWVSGIYSFDDGLTDFTQYDTNIVDDTIYIFYDSYELAALAGIEYVIDNNLI